MKFEQKKAYAVDALNSWKYYLENSDIITEEENDKHRFAVQKRINNVEFDDKANRSNNSESKLDQLDEFQSVVENKSDEYARREHPCHGIGYDDVIKNEFDDEDAYFDACREYSSALLDDAVEAIKKCIKIIESL